MDESVSKGEDAKDQRKNDKELDLQGDRLNVTLLIFLYTLQFVPRGLIQAIPLILQNRKASYTDQAEFSFVSYSFGLKILWAPIVDCVYSQTLGRRKTWLIPTQYLLGLMLLLISMNVDTWLGSDDGTHLPRIRYLIIAFFFAIFLSATQDIVVDGWSLTMLQKRNIGYSSTCNHIGSSLGSFLGFVIFIALDSKDIANKFRSVPQDRGLITFADYLFLWCWVFVISTTMVWIFKRDNSLDDLTDNLSECRLGFRESYVRLCQISKIEAVRRTCILLITSFMGFGALNGVARLKLMDAGVPRDKFVLLTVPSLPFVLIIPFVFSGYLNGQRCMHAFLASYLFKLLLGIAHALLVFFTPYAWQNETKTFSTFYYCVLLFLCNLDHMTDLIKILAAGAYVSRNSDPRFGGIYLSLFSTTLHVGSVWPASVCLWFVNILTIKSCNANGTCEVILDGFYVETILCTVIGLVWFYWGKKQINRLKKIDREAWMVNQKPISTNEILLDKNTGRMSEEK